MSAARSPDQKFPVAEGGACREPPRKAAMPGIVHALAGAIAIFTITAFWLSTAVCELFGPQTAVIAVKLIIPWGFFILIPALAAAGGSGFTMSKGRRGGLADAKLRRMRLIAANGLVVLIPCALFLASRARAGELDTVFYVVQALELIAGAANIMLLGRQMRDGMTMTKLRRGGLAKSGVT